MAVGVSGLVMLVGLQRDVGALHRDIAGLRERMAKLEGAVDGFMRGAVAHHLPPDATPEGDLVLLQRLVLRFRLRPGRRAEVEEGTALREADVTVLADPPVVWNAVRAGRDERLGLPVRRARPIQGELGLVRGGIVPVR